MGSPPTFSFEGEGVEGGNVDAEALVRPVIEGEGLELVDVTFGREDGRRILRVDGRPRRRGRTSNDLGALSDEGLAHGSTSRGSSPGPYALEVSTPGIERPLRRPEHFRRAVGQRVQVKIDGAGAGSRTHVGALLRADDEGIELDVAGDGACASRYDEVASATHGRRLGRRTEEERPMNAEMIAALRELEREKGIAFETILEGLEEAMASAYKT